MKKTFIPLFSVSALFLMLLFPVSVKADTTLSFVYTTTGQDTYCDGNPSDNSKGITNSDFHWSGKNEDDLKMLDVSGVKWTGVKDGVTACSRNTAISFSGGSYTLTLIMMQKDFSVERELPNITINSITYYAQTATWTGGSADIPSSHKLNMPFNKDITITYTATISAGNHDVSVYFPSGEKERTGVKTLTITQNAPTYAVTATASNGTVSGTGSFAEGASVTLTASPNEDYSFEGWSTSDVNISGHENENPLTFTMPNKAVSITANFTACTKHMVTLAANNNEYGSVYGGGLQCDGSVTVTATPETSYRFVNWTYTSTGAEASTDAEYTFTLLADISLTANFEEDPCSNTKTIQCEAYDPEITKPSVGHSKPSNYMVQGYRISGNDEGYGTAYGDAFASFRESGDTEIFYYLYLSAGTYTFTVRCSNGYTKKVVLYNAAGDTKLQELELGSDWDNNTWHEYTTSSWTAASSAYYYIGLRASNDWAAFDQMTITATSNVFCPNTITMAKSGDDGAAAPTAQVNSSNVTTAFEGATVTVTAGAPSANHYFSGWTVSPENAVTFANQTNATTTFVMPAEDVTITANYEASVASALTFSAGEGGSIVSATAGGDPISSGDEVISGTSVTLTAGANSNYVFINWTDDNNDAVVSTNAAFTFSMPATATAYTANFAQIDNVISQGSETGYTTSNHEGASMEESHMDDFGTFGHSVLKLSYSNMTGGNYCGWNIGKSASYNSASSAGATGFGFYYKTETDADKVAFCFDHGDSYNQYKVELPATNNVWKYHYFNKSDANNWNASNIIIYINGTDGGNTTANANGAIYLADIAATSIISKDDIANYHYTNNRGGAMQVNEYGTLCLPMDGTIEGAILYSVAGKEESDNTYIVLDEEEGNTIVAGKPYITQSTATIYTVTMSGAHSAVQDGNGLVGTYETINLTPYAEPSTLNYVLNQNFFKKAGNNVTVGAYRAYLNWGAVNAAPAQAPGARRIRMVIEGKEVETGMETVTAMPKTTKVLIDGQLFIIREGKRYTLTGARAQ